MNRAALSLDPRHASAPVHPCTLGSFVGHLGRCVYTGIYEPGHPTADADGFRNDVFGLVRELGATTLRYPGGNFIPYYRWEDGIGPREVRPTPHRPRVAQHGDRDSPAGLMDRPALGAGIAHHEET